MELDLTKLLRDYIGDIFYSTTYGEVILLSIEDNILKFQYEADIDYIHCILYDSKGVLYSTKGEMTLFPSNENRSWKKWIEENETIRIWKDFELKNEALFKFKPLIPSEEEIDKCPIGKSIKALVKINALIKHGYGGNITDNEWKDWRIDKYIIVPYTSYKEVNGIFIDILSPWKFKIIVENAQECKTPIAFHTIEQAKEFMKYSENTELVKDYYCYE